MRTVVAMPSNRRVRDAMRSITQRLARRSGIFTVGRPAGKDRQFSYSDAMKGASVTWDDATLDRWLADTESIIPDNDMSFRLDDARKRPDIIAYLKQLSGR